jgi:hypothetical protein
MPRLLDPTDAEAMLRESIQARSHWIIVAPHDLLTATVAFARISPHVGEDGMLCMMPLPTVGMVALVMVIPKSDAEPRSLLSHLGFEGDQADRLEEEMAAGQDIMLLTRCAAIVRTIADTLNGILRG